VSQGDSGAIVTEYIVVSVGRATIGLKESEIARLALSLHNLNDPAADAMVEEIEALKLACLRIDLRPNRSESRALVAAITQIITAAPGPQPRFSRLLSLVRGASA
jgi:hypothetical protein